jgi:hypothetical protein
MCPQPPVCTSPAVPWEVNENAAGVSLLGTLTCVDPDVGAYSNFTVVSATPSQPSNAFAVASADALSFSLTSLRPFNFEVIDTYNVTVRYVDGGALHASGTVVVRVQVVDVNEPPAFFAISPTPVLFLENATVGTILEAFPVWCVVRVWFEVAASDGPEMGGGGGALLLCAVGLAWVTFVVVSWVRVGDMCLPRCLCLAR